MAEPSLQERICNRAMRPCALQRSVKPFDLPLRLRMPDTTPVQPNALTYPPQSYLRISGGSLVFAPGSTVIHQHPVGNSTTLKRFFQLLTHRFATRSAVSGQRD